MNYTKVTNDSIYHLIVGIDLDIMNPIRCKNIKNMVGVLKTSKYQIKKHTNALRNEGIIFRLNGGSILWKI